MHMLDLQGGGPTMASALKHGAWRRKARQVEKDGGAAHIQPRPKMRRNPTGTGVDKVHQAVCNGGGGPTAASARRRRRRGLEMC